MSVEEDDQHRGLKRLVDDRKCESVKERSTKVCVERTLEAGPATADLNWMRRQPGGAGVAAGPGVFFFFFFSSCVSTNVFFIVFTLSNLALFSNLVLFTYSFFYFQRNML